MKTANDYAYSTAYVRALRSFLLRLDDYETLLKAKDEEDVLRCLGSTAYTKYFSEYSRKSLVLGEVDRAIFRSYYQNLEQMLRLRLTDEARNILELTYARHESSTLKTIIRLTYEGVPPDEIMHLVTFIGRYTEEYVSKMLKSKSLHEIFELEDSALRRVALEKIAECDMLNSILPVEVAIDKYYLNSLWNFTSRLQDWDKNYVRDIIGTDIDISNIGLTLRCKLFGIPFSSLRELLIPVKHRLGNELDVAVETATVSEAIRALKLGHYGVVLSGFDSEYDRERSLLSLEIGLKKYFAERCGRAFLGYPFGVAPLLAYLNLKYLECLNIREIILGKRDGISSSILSNIIILPKETASHYL
ncbi:MAG: V-type ATPase subunit [Candidatus Bathyarchaeia archaeon]